MLNILKMDLYRLFKSKFVYVLLIIVVAFMVLNAKSMQYSLDYMKENLSDFSQSTGSDDTDLVLSETLEYATGQRDYTFSIFFNSMLGGTSLFTIIAIFAAIFVNAPQKTGFIKTIAQYAPDRGMFTISNLISITIFTVIMLLVSFIGALVGFGIFFDNLNFNGFSDYIGLMLIYLLLNIAFGTFVMMFATVIKSTGLSMTIGILCSAGTGLVFFKLIDMLIRKIFETDGSFSIANYTITENITQLGLDCDNSIIVRSVVVGFVYIIVSTVISMIVMKKRDVK